MFGITIVFSLVALLVAAFGVAIKYFKCYGLIAGYNTSPKNLQEQVDVEGMGNDVGLFMFLLAGLMLISAVFAYFNIVIGFLLPLVLIFPAVIVLLVRTQKYNKSSEYKKQQKRSMIVGIVITSIAGVVIMGLFGWLLYDMNTEPKIAVDGERLTISGIPGAEVQLGDITAIELKDEAPIVKNKVVGTSIKDICRGEFNVEGLGKVKLYVHNESKPFIYITAGGDYIIVNYKEPDKTNELYKTLMGNWKK